MTQRRKVVEEPISTNDTSLATKYRPRTLADVVGQEAVLHSLKAALKAKTRPHSYCLTGPSGTGKTTIARIIAAEAGCQGANVMEIDAASNSGIDAMREVMSGLRYQGFGETPNRAIIIDEAHSLSKQAWQSLLKPMEEPPPHVFFFLCTTEPGKIPETIMTRCQSYMLKPVRTDDLIDLLEKVARQEQLDHPERFLAMVARASGGSPRQALTYLSAITGCQDEDEVARVLESPAENAEVIDLCRKLVAGNLTWDEATTTLKGLGDMPAESVRIVICNYLASCMMGSKGKGIGKLLDIYAVFAKPFPASDKMGPLLFAIGNLLFDN